MKFDVLLFLLVFIYTSDQYCNQVNCISPGLFREVFNNNKKDIKSIDALKKNPNYPDSADSYGVIDIFDAPKNVGEYYGQRIRGWLFFPQAGSYTFYSACDDVCELYLSNDTNPDNKVLIISQTGASSYNAFNSANIHLKANNKYYIEVLMAEFGRDDYLSIAVVFATGNEALSSLQPIGMSMLSAIQIENCISNCDSPEYETCIFERNSFGVCTCKYGQKVVNNQVVCQDGIETVQESVFINFEIPLLQNTIVATLKELGKEYTVSFDVYPTSLFNYWVNVIHLTIGGNMEQHGDRNPAVFFNPSTSILQIVSAINNDSNSVFNTTPIPIKQWSSIKISQQLVDQSYIYYICVNGSIVYSVVNKTPVKLSNVKVYASDPWHAAHSGSIKNLVIISKSLAYVSPGLLREVYYNNDQSIFKIDGLKKNPKYPLTPDTYGIIDMFDTPQNIAEFYGQRIRGWFVAPQTGNYTFYSSCDDSCELYISNDSDPKNKRLIINQPSYSNYMQFNKADSQSSEMVFLKENCNYYIEALMSEYLLDDHLSVGVVTPHAKGGPLMVISNILRPVCIEMCTSATCNRTVYENCLPENGVYALCTCINGQKIINNEIVCHDGVKTMQDSIFLEEEIPLIRDTYVATLNTLNKEYVISFDVKPTAFYDNWAQLTVIGNNELNGYGNPDIQFSPFSKGSFGIWSSISSLVSSAFLTKQLPLMQWSSINISQVFMDDSYVYSVYLNKTLLSSSTNMAPVVLSNITVYAADPWSVALSGSVRNLIITSRVEWANWYDWSTCNVSNGIGFINRTRLCNTQKISQLCFGSSTEFARCDKECPELESIYLPDEMLIKKNNKVATLRKFYKEYVLSFDVNPMSYNSGWYSVIHLTSLNDTNKYGDRNLTVFFNEAINGTMQICFTINGNKSYNFFTSSLPLMQWSTLKISQELFNESYMFSITLNGTVLHSVVNNQTMEISNVNVYAGNPWGDSQLGFIRNFVLITGPFGISHQWSAWSSCNVSCGYGWRIRTRDYCLTDYWEKINMASELMKCFSNGACEVSWFQWSEWSQCNVSSGSSFIKRSRICNSTNTFEWCSGNSSEFYSCLNNAMDHWSDWSPCNVSCGKSFKSRSWVCNNTHSLEFCANKTSEISDCYSNETCDDHWSNWSPCSVSCGNGFKSRSWVCNNTESLELCANKTSEKLDCYSNETCDDHWSNWSPCSVSCGNGFKNRSWVCDNTQSLELCANKTSEILNCYSNETCDGEWSTWSDCSATCGLGFKSSCNLRNSLFEDPNECKRIEKCMNKMCPVDGKWSEWIDSQPCSEVCGNYLIQRKRYCNDPSPSEGGRECWGLSEDFQLCSNSTICPVDGGWTLWSSWTFCNKPCEGGSQQRTRDCINPVPKYGGLPCNGSDKESVNCHSKECKKVSVNINLFFTDEEYIEQYFNPTKEASMELKDRIKTAIKNLYTKYNKIVYYDLEIHSMRDGIGDILKSLSDRN